MPNRILKESICTSENVEALSLEAETFFYRLIVQCDDYGRMDARASILRAKCFPLRLDRVTDKHICKWVTELEGAGLIETYAVQGHAYLHFAKWDSHQQIRAKRSKYPDPQASDANLISNDINRNQVIADVPVIQSNPIQSESNIAGNKPPAPATPPTQPDAVKELASVFEQTSGIKNPGGKNGVTWWNPLREMVKIANGSAPDILRECILNMRRDDINIYAPISTIKVFTSLSGKRITGAGGNSASAQLRAMGYVDAQGKPV